MGDGVGATPAFGFDILGDEDDFGDALSAAATSSLGSLKVESNGDDEDAVDSIVLVCEPCLDASTNACSGDAVEPELLVSGTGEVDEGTGCLGVNTGDFGAFPKVGDLTG